MIRRSSCFNDAVAVPQKWKEVATSDMRLSFSKDIDHYKQENQMFK